MTAPPPAPVQEQAIKAIAGLLDRERLMSVALNRPDGWPQVTTVGYLNEGLDLYFIVARSSQKFANAGRDSRAAVAIRSESSAAGDAFGVSMSGRVSEVVGPATIERLNRQVIARYPDVHVYCPGGDAVAVLHFTPEVLSWVGVLDGRSQAQTFSINARPASGTGELKPFQSLDVDQGKAAVQGANSPSNGDTT